MSGWYTRFVTGLVFPLHERLKGHDTVAVRRRLESSQWAPVHEIAKQQASRLREFLVEIGSRVPYYRDLFARCRFDPALVEGPADLRRLPLMTKPDIRANLERLKAEGHGPLARFNTGGSSGEPLVFFVGKGRRSHDVAAKWRATRWWGVDIGDREVVVWGSPIEVGAQDRVRTLRDRAMRSWLLPAFEMSEQNLDRFVQRIRELKPAMLFGYPSSLSLIARHAEKRSVAMDDLGLKVIFVTSERLYDDQRATLTRVFGCPVANGYGARDAGFIAHECPSGRLHLSAEDIVVEIVRPDGTVAEAGTPGEIVVTHLATAEFPLVRYRTGDVGVFDDAVCPCGRGLPVLKDVQGRTTDFVVASDGTVMHGLALIYAVRDLPGIERFRIEQLSLDETAVKLVPGDGFDPDYPERIARDFRARLGHGVKVRVEIVERLEAEGSGKFRYVVSRVPAGAGAPHA